MTQSMLSMTRHTTLTFVAAACSLVLAASVGLQAQPRAANPTARVVAIGDIHGDVEAFVSIMQRAGLIGDRNRWIGGAATLVQTGDFTDRGTGVRPVMNLLMALETHAASAGGRVVILLGNHEVMNLLRNTRDVNPKVYAGFVDSKSESRRTSAYRAYVKFRLARLSAGIASTGLQQTKEEWMAAHPLGFLEYQDAFGPNGRYGRWLRAKPVAVQLAGSIFLHAGIPPDLARLSLDDINDRVRRELEAFESYRRVLIERKLILPSFTFEEILTAAKIAVQAARTIQASGVSRNDGWGWVDDGGQQVVSVAEHILQVGGWFTLHPDGPLWFRGYATWTEEEGAPQVAALLDRYAAERFIVGHTVQTSKRITTKFGDKVFLIDTGMLTSRYGGRASALDMLGERFTAIYPDERVVLEELRVPLTVP